jgi:acetyl-CoA carboxylase biotin carboxyl carrier protein
MSLTAADVAEILRLVEGSSFDEFSLELDGLKLNFKRGADGLGSSGLPAGASSPSAAPSPPASAAASPSASIAAPVDPPAAVAAAEPNVHNVRAPMLGTFFRAPKPGEPPYVAVGDVVEKDTIVGIIEVMKLMNTVRAEVGGAVAEILVADGALVEYGEILLRIVKPD